MIISNKDTGSLNSIIIPIRGEDCVCFEHGRSGKMLLELNGTFGSLDLNCAMLVPMTLREPQLEEISDLWLTQQEHAHCLTAGESCTSSSWWVGAANPPGTVPVTHQYDYLVDMATESVRYENGLSHESMSKYEFMDYVWSEAERQFNDAHYRERWSDLTPTERLDIYCDQFAHQMDSRDWCKVPERRSLSDQILGAEQRTTELSDSTPQTRQVRDR